MRVGSRKLPRYTQVPDVFSFAASPLIDKTPSYLEVWKHMHQALEISIAEAAYY